MAASIHAGLLGNDALIVVDAVHRVRPLLQTLASVAAQRGTMSPTRRGGSDCTRRFIRTWPARFARCSTVRTPAMSLGRIWRARPGGLDGEPGRVLAYPGGCVVLAASEWTSQSALRKIALREHQQAVGARAAALAQGNGLDDELVKTMRLGSHHGHGRLLLPAAPDIGKRPAHPPVKPARKGATSGFSTGG